MRGMTEFIRDHEERLKKASFAGDFWEFHRHQILFLQHERLVHLLVMLFVLLAFLAFLILFLVFQTILLFSAFLLCLVLSIFYILHYFKLENTVIKWYFIYNHHQVPPQPEF